MSSLLEIKALAELIKNETGISKNTAGRIGNSLLEIITYFSSQPGGGGSNFVQGTVETTAALDANTVHGSWAVFLPENYADFGTAYFGLLVLPYANTTNSFVQLAVVFEDSEANTFSIRARWGAVVMGVVGWSPWRSVSGGSVAGAMLEAEYTGTGTKSVNRAVSSQYAGQANADILGRTIHETYALKQSGVTPPETARVILDDDTPTYSIVALTAENLIVENNATTGGEIIAPVLAADKTLKISIIGNDTLLDGTSYADGVTIFAIYEASTETWTFNSILDPEVPDYSDMTVDVMVDNPTITPKTGYIRITGEVWILGTMVFLHTTDTPTPIGIYRCVGSGAGYSNLKLIAAGTALHTVRVKDGDVWYGQYDGKNAGTLVFESFDNKVDKNGTDRLLTQTEAELIEGMSPIEFEVTDVINGIIIPESPTKLYRISTATDLTVTINTGLLDLTKYIKLFVKINLNDYVVLTFPENWYFANLAIPTEVGEYLYEVSSSDGGDTWRASLRYKNIATVGIDKEGNEIIGTKLLFVDGEKADNSGDGLTWLTAKKDIQAAIDIANTGDAVFVKGKIGGLKYLPTTERTPGTARSKSFIMKAGVNVYGGFKGIESTLYEREMVSYLQVIKLPTGTFNMYVDIPKYISILSGEIAGDSIIDPNVSVGNRFTTASIANNSYQVVIGQNNTTLNGFEIYGGNANVSGYVNGAAVYGGVVVNCNIHDNIATSSSSPTSAGVALYGVTANSIIITHNSTLALADAQAGAIGSSTVFKAIISNNGSSGSGSTIRGSGFAVCNSTLNYCALLNNRKVSGTSGSGAVYQCNSVNCYFAYNTAPSATSSSCINGGTATNCTMEYNSVGSAVAYSSTINNCVIQNNDSKGIDISTIAVNTIIQNNNNIGADSSTLINCTVVKNRQGTNNSIIRNTVIYHNRSTLNQKANVVNTIAAEETYSAFEDEIRAGTGNISLSVNNEGDATSPYFQSLSTDAGVVDEIYVSNPKIGNSSFLIDKGLDSLNASGYGALYDLSGLERKVDTIDIGAYENQKTV